MTRDPMSREIPSTGELVEFSVEASHEMTSDALAALRFQLESGEPFCLRAGEPVMKQILSALLDHPAYSTEALRILEEKCLVPTLVRHSPI